MKTTWLSSIYTAHGWRLLFEWTITEMSVGRKTVRFSHLKGFSDWNIGAFSPAEIRYWFHRRQKCLHFCRGRIGSRWKSLFSCALIKPKSDVLFLDDIMSAPNPLKLGILNMLSCIQYLFVLPKMFSVVCFERLPEQSVPRRVCVFVFGVSGGTCASSWTCQTSSASTRPSTYLPSSLLPGSSLSSLSSFNQRRSSLIAMP